MSSPSSLTTQQILNHRAARKAAGLVGCISGRPAPAINFFGYSDVQSWRPADPMNPHCFCFDCRDLWDRDAAIDLELVQSGHTRALEVYGELLNVLPPARTPTEHPEAVTTRLPQRSNGGGLSAETSPPSFRSYSERVPDVPPILTAPPRTYGSFSEIPMSLPAPRHRDVMNESPSERLQSDLSERRARLSGKLVPVMDKMRRSILMDPADVPAFAASVRAEEDAIWRQIDAIDVILDSLRASSVE